MWFRKLVCKFFGHKFETYIYSTGYWSYDIEQAGHCYICGVDTYDNEDNSVMSWIDIIRNKLKRK